MSSQQGNGTDDIHQKDNVASKKGKGRILIVDDEEDLRTLLAGYLEDRGYEVSSAANGQQAISVLHKKRFDLALLDIQMPVVNGIQVLKFINQNYPSTKAIILTGYADLKHAVEARESGARDFIGKPYKLEEIRATIERILSE